MIKELFAKDIYRNIEGVIKADNLSPQAIKQEIEEYVITNELEQKLDNFFEGYVKNLEGKSSNNGVWISGFFGSGKSHLLKILSYVLSNKEVEDIKAGENFLQKVEDFELKNNIQKALQIPCETILFNIDQQSDAATPKERKLLDVFIKVFNKHRGYYPKIGYIAQLEKDLDKQGIYEAFKKKFKEISGESWENGREAIWLEIESFALALSQVKNISIDDAKKLIEQYEKNYSVSIEDFAKEVDEYIQTKPKNFRLHFMVDEIGQFIGDNTELMLNLQTIVESLATIAKARAWVIVTSQEDLEKLVGVQTDRISQDFSKILGRFDIKINLTSANANEVIQKRLLLKTPNTQNDLMNLYKKEENHLRAKIRFYRGASYKNYENAEHFALNYPFVPYQFDLLKSSLIGLSKHNAFQGRHQSVGERSMLKIFQEVLLDIADEELGTLVSYDRFYDGLATTLKSEIQVDINRAKEHLQNPFALRVLKTLLLIKYVKEIVPTMDNITTLMINHFEVDIAELKQKVQKALNILEEQVYIQKVGENYEFLTDIEKDMENEIKSMPVEQIEIYKKLYEWIYDDIIKIHKIRYEANGYDYPFAKKIDDRLLKGKEEDLSLNILTPLYETDSEERIIAKSFAENDVLFQLPYDENLLKDLRLYIQTEKYLPQKQSSFLNENEKLILMAKGNSNTERRAKVIEKLTNLLQNAKIYFNGKELAIQASDPAHRVQKALSEAIDVIYPRLSMLTRAYKEEDIKHFLFASDDLFANDKESLDEASQEIYNFIRRQANSYQKVTIASLQEHYKKRPFGWYPTAINAMIAILFAKDLIELHQSGKALDKKEAFESLSKTNQYALTIIKPVKKVDTHKVQKIKDLVYKILPDLSLSSNPKELYRQVIEGFQKERATLQALKNQYASYPFVQVLDEVIALYHEIAELGYDVFFEKFLDYENRLLDTKDDIIDPLINDFLATRIQLYKTIVNFFDENRDIILEISPEDYNSLLALKKDTRPDLGNKIHKAKNIYDSLQEEIKSLLENEKSKTLAEIDQYIAQIQNNPNFAKLHQEKNNEQKNAVLHEFLDLKKLIEKTTNIHLIREKRASLKDLYIKALEMIDEFIACNEGNTEPTKKKIPIQKILPKMHTLKTKEDVKNYLQELKEKLLQAIDNDNEIIV